VLDSSLLETTDVTLGLKPQGWVIINSDAAPEELPKLGRYRVATVDAGYVAAKHGLGSATSPIVNTAILGAVARATGAVGIETVCRAIRDTVRSKSTANAEACLEAYQLTRILNKPAQ